MSTTRANGRELSPAEIDGHIGDLETRGYTIIPDALDADQIGPAIAAMEEIYARERPIAERMATQTAHAWAVHNAIGKHPFFETFYLNPAVLAVGGRLLGENMVLHDCTPRSVLPSGGREERRGFQIHVDREVFSVVPFRGSQQHFPMAINVAWCLVDFIAANGATLIWPGSHLSNELPNPQQEYPG